MPQSTLAAPSVTGVKLGHFSLTLEETTLAEIVAAVGAGDIAHRGDAGGSIYWTCYTVRSLPTSQRIWLIAHGEMGGSERRVTEVQAAFNLPAGGVRGNCPTLPNKLLPVMLSSGTWLGTSARAVRQRLGRPSSSAAEVLSYSHVSKVSGQYQGKVVEFDRAALLRVVLRHGRVASFVASQVTSY